MNPRYLYILLIDNNNNDYTNIMKHTFCMYYFFQYTNVYCIIQM